jgi:hypothetical protein
MDIPIRMVTARKRPRRPFGKSVDAPAPPLPADLGYPKSVIEEPGRRIYQYSTGEKIDVVIRLIKANGARVELLFWGDIWRTDLGPLASDLVQAASDIISSPYLSELLQYGIGSINIGSGTVVTHPEPSAPTYSGDDVKDMVWNLIDDDKFPEPDEDGGKIAYLVFCPPGTKYEKGDPGAHGSATYYEFPPDFDTIWVGWINHASLEEMLSVFSHELVEILTNPEPGTDANGREIVDVCSQVTGLVAGHKVQAYYSDRHKACIVPADRLKRSCTLKTHIVQLDPPLPSPKSQGNTSPQHENALCFSGSYGWKLVIFRQRIVVTADVSSYADPDITWNIDGLPSLPGDFTITRPIYRPADPLSQLISLPETTTAQIRVQTDGSALTIESLLGEGPVNLYIECVVKERNIPEQYGSTSKADGNVSITGSWRIMEERFWKDLERCKRSLSLKALKVQLEPRIDLGDPPSSWVNRRMLGLERKASIETNEAAMLAKFVEHSDPTMSQHLNKMAAVLEAKSLMDKVIVL